MTSFGAKAITSFGAVRECDRYHGGWPTAQQTYHQHRKTLRQQHSAPSMIRHTPHYTTHYTTHPTPLAPLLLTSDGSALMGLYLQGQKYYPAIAPDWQDTPNLPLFDQVRQQLAEYFEHQRLSFDLPLAPQGTPFQRQVWQLLPTIPYGHTTTYGELAQRLGLPTAARAIGAANGRNPISIILPCHRVVASTGHLTGYAGGLDRKQWLLQHEGLGPGLHPRCPCAPEQLSLFS